VQRELFVEEELQQSYGKLIAFVKQTEAKMGGGSTVQIDATAVVRSSIVRTALIDHAHHSSSQETLVKDFAASWKAGIELINTGSVHLFFALILCSWAPRDFD
jgi:hypothetical protein